MGIQCASDVIEFICAGASAVEVGTMNLVDPFILPAIIQDISTYCTTHDVTLSSIIGIISPFPLKVGGTR